MIKNILLVLALTALIVFGQTCTGKKIAEINPQQMSQFNFEVKKADDYFKKGSYLSLKKAFDIYERFISTPAFRVKIQAKYVKSALLIVFRQNELQIKDQTYLDKAQELADNTPALAGFLPYLKAVGIMRRYHKGLANSNTNDDSELDLYIDWINDNINILNENAKKNAAYNTFFAYLYTVLNENFRYRMKDKANLSTLLKKYSGSAIMQYKMSIFPKLDQKGLEALLISVPDFYEAYHYLGRIELQRGRLLKAEANYLKMSAWIPESLSNLLALTKVYFSLEEFDRCLQFNQKVLDIDPTYRDALLGKAISLSFLGRHEEAISVCHNLIQLGKYNMGEAYYWLAWNENELKNIDAAQENCEKAKKYLIGHYEVLFLSGVIAYEKADFKRAEKEFKAVLKLNPAYCEAAFYLGNIYAQNEDWERSGSLFESSAQCSLSRESAIRAKIKEIEESSLTKERKTRHLRKKKLQLVTIRLSRATALYNAAAGYFHTDKKAKALALAQKAAQHPNFREKAEQLVQQIKHRK